MVGIYEVSRWGRTNGRRSNQERPHSKKLNIHVISDGITRLPILEGEISHIELPRENSSLGLTIVGGVDTPLRCVVVQEVFPDGLVAQDGRLQPGDQIIEVDGLDMTGATHQQVCDALRKSTPTLRLGVYRERIEAYKSSPASVASSSSVSSEATSSFDLQNCRTSNSREESLGGQRYDTFTKESTITIPLRRHSGRHLGIKLGGRRSEPGIFIVEIIPQSIADQDNHLRVQDRILCINGEDIRYGRIEHASSLIQQSRDYVSLVISRSDNDSPRRRSHSLSQDSLFGFEENDPSIPHSASSSTSDQTSECSAIDEDANLAFHNSLSSDNAHTFPLPVEIPSVGEPIEEKGRKQFPLETEMSSPDLYGTIDSKQCHDSIRHTHRWEASLMFYESNFIQPKTKHGVVEGLSQVFGCRKDEYPVLHQKQVRLIKNRNEGLGMRIGGGLNSNEGDTPIYVANINNHGPAGKSRQIKKGDVVLSVNNNSLLGLTHSQAVSLLKATAELISVTLTLLEGPETCGGPANFVPSWLYWQRLPRALHISKSVVLHRPPGASLGFSIVGGSDPERGPEPIHVLFVVSTSPAAIDGRLRCGDRLLAVDGHGLETVSHATAVSLLKQAGQRVTLEVVSWMGTEL